MRVAAALAAAAAVLAAGCSFGKDQELENHVLGMAPRGAQMLECGWFKNWGSETESTYECYFGVEGNLVGVGDQLLADAGLQGFTVWCDGTKHRLEIAGVNGKKTLLIEVVERGFTSAQLIATDAQIPKGHVLVGIVAEKRDGASGATGRRCVPSSARG